MVRLIFIVIACHFKNKEELCETTIARLQTALKVVKSGDRIVVTGDVPYAPGGRTLGQLMWEWLTKNGFPAWGTFVLHKGVGTFSEARIACILLKNVNEITVISSPWYFFQGKPIWQRRAKESGIKISFVSVPNTGGRRTVVTYTILGLVVRVAIFIGLEKVLEDRLTASQQKRCEGFTFNGCK